MSDLAPQTSAASPDAAPTGRDAALTSVVIVTADSGDGVGDCVTRVLASTVAVEVIVVDNDSHDGAIERITAHFGQNPQVRIVQNGTNLGFGTACNRGAAIGSGDAMLFLNPDCMIDVQTIAQLRACLTADSHIGVVGALQVDPSGNIDPASRRRDPLMVRTFMSLSGLARFGASTPAFAGVALPWPSAAVSASAVEPVDAISGALMLLPRPGTSIAACGAGSENSIRQRAIRCCVRWPGAACGSCSPCGCRCCCGAV